MSNDLNHIHKERREARIAELKKKIDEKSFEVPQYILSFITRYEVNKERKQGTKTTVRERKVKENQAVDTDNQNDESMAVEQDVKSKNEEMPAEILETSIQQDEDDFASIFNDLVAIQDKLKVAVEQSTPADTTNPIDSIIQDMETFDED